MVSCREKEQSGEIEQQLLHRGSRCYINWPSTEESRCYINWPIAEESWRFIKWPIAEEKPAIHKMAHWTKLMAFGSHAVWGSVLCYGLRIDPAFSVQVGEVIRKAEWSLGAACRTLPSRLTIRTLSGNCHSIFHKQRPPSIPPKEFDVGSDGFLLTCLDCFVSCHLSNSNSSCPTLALS